MDSAKRGARPGVGCTPGVSVRRIPCGACWRVLAHDPRGRRAPFSVHSADYRESRSVLSDPTKLLGRYVLDELVIDDWLHLEQMATRLWWLRIGDDMVMISIGRDGKPKLGEWYK